MQDVKSLLEWNISPTSLKQKANFLIQSSTKDVVNKKIKVLRNHVNNSGVIRREIFRVDKDKIFYKFYNNQTKTSIELIKIFDSNKEIRILSHILDYSPKKGVNSILNSVNFSKAIDIITSLKRSSIVLLLLMFLLKKWTFFTDNIFERKIICDYINDFCKNYKGKSKVIKSINEISSLFQDRNSPDLYAIRLFDKNINIQEANILLNQGKAIMSYEYFTYVGMKYVKLLKRKGRLNTNLPDIYTWLESINNGKTNLLICSYIINTLGDKTLYADLIKSKTIELVGDPFNKNLWRREDLSSLEKQNIENARQKLNYWLNEKLLPFFFDELFSDYRRKEFWMSYLDKISNIEFCGNRYHYNDLMKNEEISSFAEKRYKITLGNSNACAIVMYFDTHVAVEFSDVGSIFIYEKNKFHVNTNNLNKIDDLKYMNENYSLFGYGYRLLLDDFEYGGYIHKKSIRMDHRGDWESRMKTWLDYHINNA